MNCQQVRDIMIGSIGKGGPEGCTRAERLAVCRHVEGCNDCGLFVERMIAEDEAKNGPIPPIVDMVIDMQMNALAASDLQDPEEK